MSLFDDIKALFAGEPAKKPAPQPKATGKARAAGSVQRGAALDSHGAGGFVRAAPDGQTRITIGTGTHAYPMPFKLENRHILATGTTGAGKTRLFFQVFDQAMARGDKAIIVDHGGEMSKRYYREGDIILNPFDKRFPGWSPYNEIRSPWDHDNIGRFVIPDGTGDGAQWHGYAQQLFAAASKRLRDRGEHSKDNLLGLLTATTNEELHEFLAGDPIAAMLAPKNDKMVASIRGIISNYLASWKYMPSGDFSIRDWVLDDNDRRWIFLSYRDSMYAALKGFISMAMSTAIIYGLDLSEDESRRIWFSLDELASLEKINAIEDALTKIRKRGGCVMAGLQSTAQLEETYGQKTAQAMYSCFGTWIALRPGDHATAEVFSKHFGEQEIWHQEFNDGQGIGGKGVNINEGVSTKLKNQRVVTATELMGLPDLQGYIKFPGNIPLAELDVPVLPPPWGDRCDPFMIRES